jgi:hypothetical protein
MQIRNVIFFFSRRSGMLLQLVEENCESKKLGISYGEFADQVPTDEHTCFHESTLMSVYAWMMYLFIGMKHDMSNTLGCFCLLMIPSE